MNINFQKTKSIKTQQHSSATLSRARSVRSNKNEKLTSFTKPMLASLHDEPFDDPDWLFEIKWDGYRAIAERSNSGIRLYSRNGLSFLKLYPGIAEEMKKINGDIILDGEIVVLNQQSRPDFQKLQQYDMNRSLPLCYYVFDCLSYKGKSLLGLPLIERKKIAEKALPKSKIIRYSDHIEEAGLEFFSKIIDMDLEGMIAKRASSPYHPGKRSRDWLKIKNHNTQEAVIAGYTAPRGSREYFGALVLGIFRDNNLKYIGHTGTGFTSALLEDVYNHLKPITRSVSPFDRKIPVNSSVTWVAPVLVCTVKYTEITEDGILRHPVFLGLRIDKSGPEANSLDVKAVVPDAGKSRTGKTKKASNVTIIGNQSRNTEKKTNKNKIRAGNHSVDLTNQDKLFWPDDNLTKGDLIQYYNTISRYILPYLKHRPESLRRNPNGIRDEGFFHKDAGHNTPTWVDTVALPSETAGKDIQYIVCNNKASLLYMANLGCIELNPWNSRIQKPDYPDYMVLDLDPSDKNTFEQVIDTATAVKEVLDQAGALSYCKTSGASGLHVYIPLKARYTYDEIRDFAGIVARLTEEKLPTTTTTQRPLNKRKGRIYLDWLQNKRGQTLASVYSVRPRPGATVSTPLLWKEVKRGLHPSQFTIRTIEKRLNKTGDLFRDVLKETTDLKKCLKNLGV